MRFDAELFCIIIRTSSLAESDGLRVKSDSSVNVLLKDAEFVKNPGIVGSGVGAGPVSLKSVSLDESASSNFEVIPA